MLGPLPVTLVAGFAEPARHRVAERLLQAAPSAVLVRYDVSRLADGIAVRIARSRSGEIDRETVRMDHPCVSCALRDSLVPLLLSVAGAERYSGAIVSVPAAGDVQALARQVLAEGASDLLVDSVVAVLDTDDLVADLTGDDLVPDRAVPTAAEDGRAVAEVIARHLEYANVAVLTRRDPVAEALARAINPHAVLTTPDGIPELAGARLYAPDAAAAAVEPGAVTAPLDDGADGVRTVLWQSARPFHPQRLFDALEPLVAGTARGRGTLWLASQPHLRLGWESFGPYVAIASLGPWLADLPADRWSEIGEAHRARSALEWHPEHGDRASYLSITGVGLDPWESTRLLDSCLLRTHEWHSELTDPFAPYLEGTSAA